MSGIYKIINLITNKVYIGSAVNLDRRKISHISPLRNNTHPNKHLQRAWNKYGEENFKFEVIEYVEDKNKLLEKEQYWIDKYQSYNREKGYNILPTAGSCLGWKMPEEIKNKISNALKNKKHSREHIQKLLEARKGLKFSEETKIKMSKMRLGEGNGFYGKHHTEETKKKIRDANHGKIHSEEHKKKISNKCKGELNGNSSLTENEVKNIKIMIRDGISNKKIMDKFNISKQELSFIRIGYTWKHVKVEGYIEKPQVKQLTQDEVLQIKKMIHNKIKQIEIAKKYNVSPTTISNIKNNKIYKNLEVDYE